MTGPERQLVVNADDLGWSGSINRGIVEAHVDGIVTSASLLVTAPAFEDAVELAKTAPALSLGVHLNFYRGQPILDPARLRSLTGDDGRFLGSVERIVWSLITRRLDMRELADEFRAQIELVKSLGVEPSHLDSDKHLHLWPSVFELVCDLAVEYGIRNVRLLREPATLQPIALGLSALSVRNASVARRCGLVVPDGTIGVAEAPIDLATLARLLERARGQKVELVVHPGHLDEEFWELQSTMPNKLSDVRERQQEVLGSPAAKELIEEHSYTLCDRLSAT